MNGFLLWIQLEEKRAGKGKRVGRESFWILFSEKYVYIYISCIPFLFFFLLPLPLLLFLPPFFIPLWFDTRGCIVEKAVV